MCSNLLPVLKELRSEIHGRVDEVFVRKLDAVIDLVESSGGESGHLAQADKLKLLTKGLETLPSLLHLIDQLFRG